MRTFNIKLQLNLDPYFRELYSLFRIEEESIPKVSWVLLLDTLVIHSDMYEYHFNESLAPFHVHSTTSMHCKKVVNFPNFATDQTFPGEE